MKTPIFNSNAKGRTCPTPSLLSETQLKDIRGGMFAPFINKPFDAAGSAAKAGATPQTPVTQGLGTAMAKGAVIGGLAGAPTGNAVTGAAGGALLGGMDHCMDRLPAIGPSPVPCNLNIVSRVHPYAYGHIKEM